RRFRRSGDHPPARGVRRELIQATIFRTTPNDVDLLNRISRKLLETGNDRTILQRQTLQYRPCVSTRGIRMRLLRSPAICVDCTRHVRGIEEGGVVGVDQYLERRL